MTDESAKSAPCQAYMPGRTPENAPQPADFQPVAVAKTLLRATRAGTLATLDRNSGYPFASLVNVATDSRRRAADPGVEARHPYRQSGSRMAGPRCCWPRPARATLWRIRG